jgi:type IV pilus assembly protein PilA
MLTRLRHRVQGQGGFTLIELLVVILIIGILAAVAIPAFLNQRGKAQDANTKSDINTAQTAEETYYTDSQAYTTNMPDLTNIESTLQSAVGGTENMTLSTTPAVSASIPAGASVQYGITANSQSGVVYGLTKFSDGTVSRTCNTSSAANSSGCKVTGTSKQGVW